MKTRHGLGRRRFLTLTGGACATGCATSSLDSNSDVPAADANAAAGQWAEVRAAFDQDPAWTNFCGFLLTPHPEPVRAAIEEHRRALDRNPALVMEQMIAKLMSGKPHPETDARQSAADFLGGKPDQVALTDSTTMGLGLVYGGFRLQPGQRVLTTTHDHYSSDTAWEHRTRGDGAVVDRVPLYEDAAKVSVDDVVSRIVAGIKPQTRLVAVTWVHSSSGVKLPIRAIADALAKVNRKRDAKTRVFLAVDGVHGFGIENVTATDLGCDVFIAGCHKWLFGPRGTGLVWATEEAWEEITPTIAPFEAPPFVAWLQRKPARGPGGLMNSPGGFHSFEHRWALPAAFAFQTKIGRAAIEERIHSLNTRLKDGLAKVDGIRIHTPMDVALSSGMVAFEVRGKTPDEVVAALHEHKILGSASPYSVPYPRLAPGLLNDEEQVDRAVEVLRTMVA